MTTLLAIPASIMADPVKHYGKWRIRWTDETGQRRSASFDNHKDAAYCLRQKELEVENIKRGFKTPIAKNKLFAEICDYKCVGVFSSSIPRVKRSS
ncbi:MAG: hypothetical protein NTV34_19130 [Proteobacteria bacterium]|nr:hypothetical protein [Pseudomonadota bacterium]